MAGKLIFDVSFNSQTRVLSLSDRAGNVISSCEVPARVNPEPLTFTAKENSSVIKLVKHGELENTYEVDTGTGWRSYTLGLAITRNNGRTVKFRCTSHPTTQSEDNYVQFEMSGLFEASGNVNSMLTGDFVHLKSLVGYDYAFYKLIPKDKAMRMFMFKKSYQVQHVNGLTFDFLFDMAKKLHDAKAMMLVGAGAKGTEPLVMSNGGTPYRAFLEGRVEGDTYVLILRLTNLELKEIPSK